MKALLLMIFLLSLPSGGIKTISRLNQYAAEAAKAYQEQDYFRAITAYEYILNDLGIEDDQLRLNLAHSYFRANLNEKAQEQYFTLANHQSNHMVAVVHLQLGNIVVKNKKYKQALSFYKKALLAEPSNEAARYNYELLKKYLALHPEKAKEETEQEQAPPAGSVPPPSDMVLQPKQQPDNQGSGQAETDTNQPDKQGEQQSEGQQKDHPSGEKEKEQNAGEEPGETEGQRSSSEINANERRGSSQSISEEDTRARMHRDRLQKANITPEKARLLLDAMRNTELQYMQQLPKKATKKPEKGKPDW